jgi:hypothetical protein
LFLKSVQTRARNCSPDIADMENLRLDAADWTLYVNEAGIVVAATATVCCNAGARLVNEPSGPQDTVDWMSTLNLFYNTPLPITFKRETPSTPDRRLIRKEKLKVERRFNIMRYKKREVRWSTRRSNAN